MCLIGDSSSISKFDERKTADAPLRRLELEQYVEYSKELIQNLKEIVDMSTALFTENHHILGIMLSVINTNFVFNRLKGNIQPTKYHV